MDWVAVSPLPAAQWLLFESNRGEVSFFLRPGTVKVTVREAPHSVELLCLTSVPCRRQPSTWAFIRSQASVFLSERYLASTVPRSPPSVSPIDAALSVLPAPPPGEAVPDSSSQIPSSAPLAVPLVPVSTVETVPSITSVPQISERISNSASVDTVPIISPPSPSVVFSAQPVSSAATSSVVPSMINPPSSTPSLAPRPALRSVPVEVYVSPLPPCRSAPTKLVGTIQPSVATEPAVASSPRGSVIALLRERLEHCDAEFFQLDKGLLAREDRVLEL